MSVGPIGSSGVPGGGIQPVHVETVACDDALAVMVSEVSEQLDRSRASSREARSASREAQAERQESEIAKMREAATYTMAAGIVQGSLTIACAAAKGVGVGVAGGTAAAGGTAPQSGVDAGWDQVGKGIEGASQIAGGILGEVSKQREADAASERQAAEREGGRVEDQTEDAREMRRAQEQALEAASQILQARRQAEQAALRG
jgi:hypothetical protein